MAVRRGTVLGSATLGIPYTSDINKLEIQIQSEWTDPGSGYIQIKAEQCTVDYRKH
jgi:hypothetical protein